MVPGYRISYIPHAFPRSVIYVERTEAPLAIIETDDIRAIEEDVQQTDGRSLFRLSIFQGVVASTSLTVLETN
jgi:hypothetical protein